MKNGNDNNNHGWPKSDLRYWENKVAFQSAASRTYSVQIQHANRRAWINLYTANRTQAAVLARKFYEDLRANGWDATLARRKGPDAEKKVNVSVGEYIEAVGARSLFTPKTFQSYAQALRQIVGDITATRGRKRRDLIRLRTITPEKIETWRIEFIRRKATDPLAERSARISASSLLLRARALFAPPTVARVRDLVEIPDPMPFHGVKAEAVRVPRYRSTFDLAELLESAREELALQHPEQYKIFLLGAMAGLRRNEIDVLPWTAFRWDEGVIRIEATEFYRPKSEHSEGDVRVDPELLEIFQGYYAGRKGGFVIESEAKPLPFDAPYGVYRCMKEMRALLGWLRAKGVVSKTPLHTCELLDTATVAELRKPTDGTKWNNEQLLFHMLFGYLLVRNLRLLVWVFSRLADDASKRFADAHRVRWWGLASLPLSTDCRD